MNISNFLLKKNLTYFIKLIEYFFINFINFLMIINIFINHYKYIYIYII
jgi:hypothetical protein